VAAGLFEPQPTTAATAIRGNAMAPPRDEGRSAVRSGLAPFGTDVFDRARRDDR
jgi:hypothetical protein